MSKIISCFICCLLITETWQFIRLTVCFQYVIDIRQSAEILHKHEMEPSTEEIKLSFYQIFFFLCGIYQLIEVSYTEISFTDTIPHEGPHAFLHTVIVGSSTSTIHPVGSPTVVFLLPSPEVAIIHLITHEPCRAGYNDFVFAPIEVRLPIVAMEKWYAIIQFFGKSLEITEVLECVFLIHDAFLVPVKVILA